MIVSMSAADRRQSSAYLVFNIFRNAPTVDIRTTMCARPVHVSVTTMVGHEKVRNSSKVSNSAPHDRSYLRSKKL